MKISLRGNVSSLLHGIEELQEDYAFTLSDNGYPLAIIQQKNAPLTVSADKEAGKIIYDERAHFFRAFGLFLENLQSSNEFHIEEVPQFTTVGPMFDLSRNAVMKVEAFKGLIRKLAMMGFNSAMLYMEDTYEVKEEPYFGYMRGRYTQTELKELDDYAFFLGIELIPCIQTLAHLEEFLKWDATAHLKDTRGVLLVESEETYSFIEKMIVAASKPFRSRRIHIGMDEAEELGRGIYLNKHGYKKRFDLMVDHLERVMAIVKEKQLEPMLWSDMFIKLASSTGEDHYNLSTAISDYIVEKTPKDVQLMYWDYAHTKKEEYVEMIKKHKAFKSKPAFAGGIWVWNSFGTNYNLSLTASEAALQACKQEGVSDVFVTLWGDDGYENNYYTALLGLQFYAEHAYSRELNREKWKQRVKFCTGINAEAYLLFNELDQITGVIEEKTEQTNPSKFLLWQDVLLGVFDKQIEGIDITSHYASLENKVKRIRNADNEIDFIFDVPEKLCAVLSMKANLGIRLKEAYDRDDKNTLQSIAQSELPELISRVEQLRNAHREQWFRMHKPFGWEVIDIRYGGVVSRLDTASKRIEDYLNGHIAQIEELEQERLRFSNKPTENLGWCSYYYRMATPNVFFHVLPIY
ncbi:beta-N-acetylhexosaminidase [Evansella cellulosilytica]|uniref:Glycoside hydrolase, family 20, catalytic core n=1 Tax=Evansella cellulosilytica (strain ATCC 21833 / DSM 2522 / FERM P-1141 / JCM 9156 / N-4) TaxID=649639 RepID=E6TT35_EVAC2|nr:beta-N-acetylhexosaminidase [Evansella cellulosilytica]ADU31943.1 Glycoside hydrolase, family 20, catalytic core [Evansella cellulosilytica DSM 2522]